MHHYQNRGGNSGVIGFIGGETLIDVQFKGGMIYRYRYSSAGASAVEKMKQLAASGIGLGSYISTNKPQHVSKWQG